MAGLEGGRERGFCTREDSVQETAISVFVFLAADAKRLKEFIALTRLDRTQFLIAWCFRDAVRIFLVDIAVVRAVNSYLSDSTAVTPLTLDDRHPDPASDGRLRPSYPGWRRDRLGVAVLLEFAMVLARAPVRVADYLQNKACA
jgi:hypothetical protein